MQVGLAKIAVIWCVALLLSFNANIVFAGDTNKLDIDLIAATINKTNIFDLTLDQVTDLIGRPAMVREPGEYKNSKGETIKYGASLYYFDQGLSFHFNHPEGDSQQHQQGVYVYLSRTWDKERRNFFQPFQGTLSKGLDGTWKVKRVMKEFNEFSPKDRYDAVEVQKRKTELENIIGKMREAAKKAGQDPTESIDQLRETEKFLENLSAEIWITNSTHTLMMSYEENTKFIEKIYLGKRK